MACQLPAVRGWVPNGPWPCNHLGVGGLGIHALVNRGGTLSLNLGKLGMRTKLRTQVSWRLHRQFCHCSVLQIQEASWLFATENENAGK